MAEEEDTYYLRGLNAINTERCTYPFFSENGHWYGLFYPVVIPKKKKLVPFTWEDREMLRGKWIRRKDNHECESMINKVFIGINGNMYINNILATSLLNGWEFLDGKHFGKEVDE